MRELLLLRHAEAMTAGPNERDSERPLSLRGGTQARAVGAWLAEQPAPDAVLCSPARRARMTADAVQQAVPVPPPQILPAIYAATPGDLVTSIEVHASAARRILLVGHNPGLEQLLALLTHGRSTPARGLSPAMLAWICFDDDVLEPGRGRLHAIRSP